MVFEAPCQAAVSPNICKVLPGELVFLTRNDGLYDRTDNLFNSIFSSTTFWICDARLLPSCISRRIDFLALSLLGDSHSSKNLNTDGTARTRCAERQLFSNYFFIECCALEPKAILANFKIPLLVDQVG